MPYKQNSYTPQDDSLTGFLSNATGATWTLTTTTPGDDLAHKVSIRNDSVTNHSAKTAVLTGTDADGKVQTETLALPNTSATVISVKYYKTLITVVPSATIGSDTMDIGWTDDVVTPTYIVNYMSRPMSLSFCVSVTGTIDYTVQHTHDDPHASSTALQDAIWINNEDVAAETTTMDSNYAFPCRAIRLLLNSLTTGATFKFTITEGGP